MPNSPYTNTSLHCPNQAQWLRYRRGQSSPLETRAIEEHFTNCALCSEAIDTIMNTDADVLEAQWSSLKKPSRISANPTTLSGETKKAKTIVHILSPWLVAALLCGVIIGAYFIYQQNNQAIHTPLAQNTPSNITSPTPPATAINTPNKPNPASSNKPINEQNLPTNNSIAGIKYIEPATSAAVKANTAKAQLNEVSNSVAVEEQSYSAPENARMAQADETIHFQQAEAPANVETDRIAASPISAANTKETTVAKAYKNEKSLLLQEKKVAQPIAASPSPSGSELYLNGQYAEAIPGLLLVVKKQSPYQMEAIFLADAYSKTGNIRAAKSWLQVVIKQNGPYAKKAQQMLDLINEN